MPGIDWVEVFKLGLAAAKAVVEAVQGNQTSVLEALRLVLPPGEELERLDRVQDQMLQARAEAELAK